MKQDTSEKLTCALRDAEKTIESLRLQEWAALHEVEKLKEELDKERARLDWLEMHLEKLIRVMPQANRTPWRMYHTFGKISDHITIRETIDAAMKQP